MNDKFVCCLRKDLKEYLRKKYNIICLGILLGFALLILLMSKYFPMILNMAIEKHNNILTGSDTLNHITTSVFPQNIKENIGIFSSDVVIFYGLVVIMIVHNIVPQELYSGKWIPPIGAGYTKKELLHSKATIYSLGMSFPVLVIYNLYYIATTFVLRNNYDVRIAIINSIVLAVIIFFIVYITIMLSVIYKKTMLSAITSSVIIIFAPDIFSLFSFCKYLPTYLLTYVYQSSTLVYNLIIPFIEMIAVYVVLIKIANKKIEILEVLR